MDDVLKILQDALLAVLDFALFVIVSIFFIPAFLIVTYLQKYWTKKLEGLFGL